MGVLCVVWGVGDALDGEGGPGSTGVEAREDGERGCLGASGSRSRVRLGGGGLWGENNFGMDRGVRVRM